MPKPKKSDHDHSQRQPRVTLEEDLHAVVMLKTKGKTRNAYHEYVNRVLRRAFVESKLIPDDLEKPVEE